MFPLAGLRRAPIAAGFLGLGINYGAYLSEVFRAGIAAVPKGQSEAAGALGFAPRRTVRLVVLPQPIRIVIPPVGNYFVSLFKDTALGRARPSTISIAELMFTGQLIASETCKYIRKRRHSDHHDIKPPAVAAAVNMWATRQPGPSKRHVYSVLVERPGDRIPPDPHGCWSPVVFSAESFQLQILHRTQFNLPRGWTGINAFGPLHFKSTVVSSFFSVQPRRAT